MSPRRADPCIARAFVAVTTLLQAARTDLAQVAVTLHPYAQWFRHALADDQRILQPFVRLERDRERRQATLVSPPERQG
jgi:hypothetical protein